MLPTTHFGVDTDEHATKYACESDAGGCNRAGGASGCSSAGIDEANIPICSHLVGVGFRTTLRQLRMRS